MSAIEDAAYNTVHDYPGGAEALAPRMGKSAKVLDSKVNRNEFRHHLTLREAVQIMGLTGDHRMVRAICRHLGYLDPIRAVVYEGIADEQLLELVAAATVTSSDHEFESFDEQTIEAMTALAELRDRLRGMVVEDPVSLRKV
ncbi:MAG: hypothetical protein IPK20_22085 [Betaproteobacteria bacterium]|nr:hypothetical protein [Betaproteobacteria bacterium]